MEMQQVRYFLAVAEHLSFTRAADTCNVSQPSISRAIKLLEEELGGALFHRERANTHLSELGRLVHPHLRQVYQESLATKRLAQDFSKLRKATLKIGVMCTIAPTHLVDFVASVRERHPGIDIELRDSSAQQLNSMLLEGDLEVGIYCLPGEEPDPVLHVMPLFREQMMIVVHPAHKFADRNAICVSDLDGQRFLSRTNCEFSGYGAAMFAARGVSCETVYRSERDDWILAMASAGHGFAFMPEFSVNGAEVVARPLVEPELWREVNLITVRGRPHSPAVGALVREAMRVRWQGQPAMAVTNTSSEMVAKAA